jgi:digeranylgeranylglycerophospholipid reductase
VIVGAGPAGAAVAAAVRQHSDLSVLMVDRRTHVGFPPQCAGGIVKQWLDKEDLEIPGSVVAARLVGGIIHGPNGYVMLRDRFDQWMVDRAVGLGADLQLREDPSKTRRAITSTPYGYNCRFLVGADGWRSQLGRAYGLTKKLTKADYHAGIEYRVRLHEPHEAQHIHLYFGNQVAPTGYVWVFPESTEIVKIGCGVSPLEGPPREFLDRFVKDQNETEGPWAGTLECVSSGGIIPTTKPVEHLYQTVPVTAKDPPEHEVAVVGDAARMTDPLHGGGIANGIVAGHQLGRAIADDDLNRYQQWFDKYMRKELERRFYLAMVINGWKDPELDAMIASMGDVKVDGPINAEVRKFIWRLIKKKPLMFPKAALGILKAKWSS